MNLLKTRPWLSAGVLALVLLAGCGSSKTDVSAGVADVNTQLKPEGVSLECPKEVQGGENTQFDCKLKGKAGKEADVKMKIVKEGGELKVDLADPAAFDQARESVAGG